MDTIKTFYPILQELIARGYGCRKREIGYCDGACRGLPISLDLSRQCVKQIIFIINKWKFDYKRGNPKMLSAIINRRSIRNYKGVDVPRHMIEKILQSGILAPSSKNRQLDGVNVNLKIGGYVSLYEIVPKTYLLSTNTRLKQ